LIRVTKKVSQICGLLWLPGIGLDGRLSASVKIACLSRLQNVRSDPNGTPDCYKTRTNDSPFIDFP
jgi:hypothetical protein